MIGGVGGEGGVMWATSPDKRASTQLVSRKSEVKLLHKVWNLGPGTWVLEPGTLSLGPGTWVLEPGTWNLEPE